MKYLRVPILSGVLQVDYALMRRGVATSSTEAIVEVEDSHPDRPDYQSATAADLAAVSPPTLAPVLVTWPGLLAGALALPESDQAAKIDKLLALVKALSVRVKEVG